MGSKSGLIHFYERIKASARLECCVVLGAEHCRASYVQDTFQLRTILCVFEEDNMNLARIGACNATVTVGCFCNTDVGRVLLKLHSSY